MLLPILAALFFVSGFSALIYQVLWLRMLGVVFGITTYAASTVLASFMGGLAAGSLVAGRLADRVKHPLRWFGAAEALIGATALASLPIIRGLADAYPAIRALAPGGLLTLTVVRFLTCSAILIVPTSLMGASLPLITRSSLARVDQLGSRVGLLYATNTAGAIAGTLGAGYYLIGGVGIRAAFLVAATGNVLVGLIAVAISMWGRRLLRPAMTPAGADANSDIATGSDETSVAVRRLVLIVFALSGAAALALEVIWFRVLVVFVPATTYAFTAMLATVLAGIAVGSAIVTPLMRRRGDWVGRLAMAELALSITALLSLSAVARGFEAGLKVGNAFSASALAIFPAALLMGIAFPIGVRLWAGRDPEADSRVARRIGSLYAVNVCGGVIGSIAAGFWLLPWLGSQGALTAAASLPLFAGLALLRHARRGRIVAAAVAAASILVFVTAARRLPDPLAAALARRYPGEQVFWREEGIQGTVAVHVRPMGGRVLYLDGLHQANTSAAMVRTHRQIGLLALALHPNPRNALVIGLGGGAAGGAVSRDPSVAVTVVELSPSVVRAAAWFRDVNDDVLNRPNVRVRIDDGRNFLLVSRERYDLITADVIQPFHAGAGNVYAIEYFRLARRALADDGLMVQWIGRRAATPYKLIMRTFLAAFPDATLWADGTLMVGAKAPLQLEGAAFERKLRDPALAGALASVGLDSFESLLDTYTGGPEEMRRLVGPGPLLTDNQPMTEFFRALPQNEPDVDVTGVSGDVKRHLAGREIQDRMPPRED